MNKMRIVQHKGVVRALHMSHDKVYLATASFDNTARITKINDGTIICTVQHKA